MRCPARRLLLALALPLAAVASAFGAAKSVEVTHVPVAGQRTDRTLTGRLHGVAPAAVRLAIYIEVDGGWYPKPSSANPFATLAADGTWTANIAPVVSDQYATQIAALIVPTGFTPPTVDGDTWLPDTLMQATLAYAIVGRAKSDGHSVHWSGYDWKIRDTAGVRQGPGPNLFSAAAENVFVDAANRLHLKITGSGTTWNCAELQTYRTLGYGRYTFRTATACDQLDTNAVLGLFTWAEGSVDPNYREIDIEWSRWGEAADTTNAQFVVQPFAPVGHLKRITVPAATTELTQGFDWSPTGVAFFASATGYTAAWSYPPTTVESPNLPVSADEKVHLNLWLYKSAPPSSGLPVEVVLTSFTFQGADTDSDGLPDTWERSFGLAPADPTDAARDDDGDGATNLAEFAADTDPADPASVFRITQYTYAGAAHTITFTARPDRFYDVETISTLESASWTPVAANLSGTTSTLTATLPAPADGARAFYRVRVKAAL